MLSFQDCANDLWWRSSGVTCSVSGGSKCRNQLKVLPLVVSRHRKQLAHVTTLQALQSDENLTRNEHIKSVDVLHQSSNLG